MKKITLGILLLLFIVNADAQYQKASFLNKTGRTYELGTDFQFIGKSNATVTGIYYSYGKDRGKRMFHWFDFEFLLPTTYSYKTTDINTQAPISVNGKSSMGFIFRYNVGMYLMDNSNEETKLLPFVVAGINTAILGAGLNGNYTTNPDQATPAEIPQSNVLSMGFNVGVGAVYKISEKVGLKCNVGYDVQSNFGANSVDQTNGASAFYFLTSHPYLTLGIRFRMERED